MGCRKSVSGDEIRPGEACSSDPDASLLGRIDCSRVCTSGQAEQEYHDDVTHSAVPVLVYEFRVVMTCRQFLRMEDCRSSCPAVVPLVSRIAAATGLVR